MSNTENTRPVAVLELDPSTKRVGKRATTGRVIIRGGIKSAFTRAKAQRRHATTNRRQRDRRTIRRALQSGDMYDIDFLPIPDDRRHIGYP